MSQEMLVTVYVSTEMTEKVGKKEVFASLSNPRTAGMNNVYEADCRVFTECAGRGQTFVARRRDTYYEIVA